MTRAEAEKIAMKITIKATGVANGIAYIKAEIIEAITSALLEASKLGHVGDEEIEKHIKQKRNPEMDPQLCKMFEGYWIAGAKWYRSKITEDK